MAILADKRDGKVTGRWRVELQVNGVRLRKRFDTIEEARAFEAKARLEMASGKTPEEARPRIEKPRNTVETMAQLARAVEGQLWVGDSTERASHQMLERITNIIGPNCLIESITIADIDRMVNVLRQRQTAPGTINRYLSNITTALKWALKRGYRTAALPVMEWQDEDEGRIRWITPEEEAQLIGLLPRPEALVVFVAIRTGMRRGEVLGLSARDVEKGWVHLWGTKTKSGKGRSIPLTPDVYVALCDLFKTGKPNEESLRYHWNKAKETMGLTEDEDFVFHATRHTFATRAVQSGVHPRVLQRLMGHANLATTMRYMQVSDSMLSAAIEQMASVSNAIQWGPPVGALQGGANQLNPPQHYAGLSSISLRKQELRQDLGSSGETRGGSSPSARTMPNERDKS